MRKVLSEKEVIKIIEEKLPELIEKYPLLRLKIEEIIERKAVTKEEIKEILIELRKQREENSKRFEEINKRFEAVDKRFEEMDRRFEALVNELKAHKEETAKRFEELTKEMNKGFELLRNAITALGARWGIFAEEAFREGMKGVIENLGFPSYEIKKWKTFDEEGYVFGYPHEVEVDIVIKDDKHFLIEIKSSVSDADVLKFKKIGELYEKKKRM